MISHLGLQVPLTYPEHPGLETQAARVEVISNTLDREDSFPFHRFQATEPFLPQRILLLLLNQRRFGTSDHWLCQAGQISHLLGLWARSWRPLVTASSPLILCFRLPRSILFHWVSPFMSASFKAHLRELLKPLEGSLFAAIVKIQGCRLGYTEDRA